MKKITALFLSLVMLLSIICSSALTVSAASSNNGWQEVFNSQGYYDTVQIFKKDVKSGNTYYSQLKFVINGQEKYMTKTYSKWRSACTVKDICEKDTKLTRAKIWNSIDKITDNKINHDVIVDMMVNYSSDTMNTWSVRQFKNAVFDTSKGFCKNTLDDVALDALGVSVPFSFQIYSDISSFFNNIRTISEYSLNVVAIWNHQAEKALGIAETADKVQTQYSSIIAGETDTLCFIIKNNLK